MAFDFSRAVQSTFASVFCASGAFTAYRREALLPVADRWLKQRFLGRPCTFGEDRSLTNCILRAGWLTLYQRRAWAYTIVPETLGKLLKMFTRWARSNLRESVILASFLFHPAWRGRRLLAGLEFASTVALLLLHFLWFYIFLFSGLFTWNLGLRLLTFSLLFGFFTMLYYMRIAGRRDALYVLLFSLFSSLFMVGIFTWAGLTIAQRSWSTR
jgi:hyaluronan synthase